MNYYVGIEAGGTKFRCLIAHDHEHVLAEKVFPTTDPNQTLPSIIDYLEKATNELSIPIEYLGLASFGPVDLDPSSPTYGWITSTPKIAWRNFPILRYFEEHLNIPVKFETDVTAAALGEGKWGAAVGLSDFVYITVGTGIGGGVIHDNKPLFGMAHPEIGHMKLQPHPDDPFPGNCPYHVNCLEGLANAPSLAARWNVDPASLPDDHRAWNFEAYYLGQAIHNLIMVYAPKKIILGGGVLKRPGLLEKVRIETVKILNGYINTTYLENMATYIVPPELGDRAGALGAISLLLE